MMSDSHVIMTKLVVFNFPLYNFRRNEKWDISGFTDICTTFSCITAKLWWARSFDTSASHEPGCYIVSVSTVKLISFQHFITGNKFWSEWSVGREGRTHLENFLYFLLSLEESRKGWGLGGWEVSRFHKLMELTI